MGRLRISLCLLLAGLLAGSLLPSAASGGEWVEEVPAEPDTVMLPHLVFDAVTADLDGDGARELIRLIPGVMIGGAMAVDVWKRSADGWHALRDPQPVHREARVGEFAPKRVSSLQSELAPVLPREPSRLLVMRDGSRERVLVAATGEPNTGRDCCLTVWQVEPSGLLSLVPVVGTVRTAESLLALDLTGDGRDELLATTPPDTDLTTQSGLLVAAYRLADGQLQVIDRAEAQVDHARMPVAVSGNAGAAEMAVLVDHADDPSLHRFSLDPEGRLLHETASIPSPGRVGEGTWDGRSILVVSGDRELIGLHWPVQEEPALVARTPIGGDLLPAIGDGSQARIPVAHRPPNVLHLLAPDLQPDGSVTQTEPVGRLLGTPVAPYVGPLPGGDLSGRQAVVFRGRLLHAEAADAPSAGGIEVAVVASFAAAQPVGYLGTGDWLAVLHTLGPWFDLDRGGGELAVARTFQDGRLAIVPAAVALTEETGGGRLRPPISGAVVTGDLGDRQQIMARREGFEVVLAAPPGSRVLPVIGDPPLPADARLVLVPPSGEVRVRIQPPVATPARSRYQARLVVVAPSGKAYTAAWQVEVRDEPPDLEADADPSAFSFRVPVSGQTEPGVAVSVDGEAVMVDDDGSFSGRVSGSLWPRMVRIEAVDPLGNRATETVSVVAPIDYRALPWIPIVVALTIAAAAIIFLRAPRPSASRAAGEASLHELGADEEVDTGERPG